MKALFIALFMSISIIGFSQIEYQQVPKDYGYKVKIGDIVPDFDIRLPDGTTIPIKSLRGKVVMLQFTASWCSVCRKEMPHIESKIWQKLKGNSNFRLYGIDLKESIEKTNAFQKDMKITYRLALDSDGSIFELFTVPNAGVTRNIIVDQKGKILFMTRLFKEKEFNEMVRVINGLL